MTGGTGRGGLGTTNPIIGATVGPGSQNPSLGSTGLNRIRQQSGLGGSAAGSADGRAEELPWTR